MTSNVKPTTIGINTISQPKLTTMLNDFIIKTVNHLNKLSTHVESKLSKFDNKLREIEIMVTLLESKLNSLPTDITSKYPPLVHCSLNEINPEINLIGLNSNLLQENSSKEIKEISNPPQIQVIPVENVNSEISPENKDEKLIEQNKIEPIEPIPEPIEETPEQKLKSFVDQNHSEDLERLLKMLKFGIQEPAVLQKARLTGFDMEIVKTLIELYKAANPNPY